LPGSRGYALTSKAALKNILDGISLQDQSFLDIGSGKGGVIIYSQQLGCKKSAGIEYEKHLHDIAVKNIKILGMESNCKSFNIDARDFKDYGDFSIFFLFNPFSDDIYHEVLNKIKMQINISKDKKTKYLICYGGANISAVQETGIFSLIREDRCPYRGTMFRVFKLRYPD
jgi:16S rRNA G966 N2-methylase RsmD